MVSRGGSPKREVSRTSGQRPPKSGDSQSLENDKRIAQLESQVWAMLDDIAGLTSGISLHFHAVKERSPDGRSASDLAKAADVVFVRTLRGMMAMAKRGDR